MTDLIVAIIVMSVLALVAGVFTATIAYSAKGQWTMLGLTLAVASTVFFIFYGSGQLVWAKFITSSAAIVYSNVAPIFAAMAAGWGFRLPKTPRWRQTGLALLLGGASLVTVFWPLLSIAIRPPPQGGQQWNGPVAMQTSWATCSPAAAATLLRAEGIEVSESDLVGPCLTDSSGTPTLGLYRGIKLLATEHGREVSMINGDLATLAADDDWPVLIAVKLPFGTQDRRYKEQWGWIPGMGHSVVALGRTNDGRYVIADPSVGVEAWTEADMELLWHGDGIRVE